MIIGAILQTAAVDYAMMIVARIITGLGNGLNVSAIHYPHQWTEFEFMLSDFNGSFVPRRMFARYETWCINYVGG